MNEFIKVLLSLSLSGTLLFLLVLLPKPLCKERFSRCWQYYIWLVVALRFVLPFTPDGTFTGYLFARMENAALPEENENNPASDMSISGMLLAVSEKEDFGSGAAASVSGRNPGNGKPEYSVFASDSDYAKSSQNILTEGSWKLSYLGSCLFYIWLVVTLILLLRKILIYRSFFISVKNTSRQISDIKILNLLADCTEQLNVKGKMEVRISPLITSPVLVGFFHPCILLPDGVNSMCGKDVMSDEGLGSEKADRVYLDKLYYIFIHELIHFKRWDMFYKWFIQLILCVHWFNPFVYCLAGEIGNACELACDEAVAAGLDTAGKKAYGNTLLAFLRTKNDYKSSTPYVTLSEGAKGLKERLGTIMKSQKKTKKVTWITAAATVVICICFTALGAYAKSSEEDGFVNSSNDSDKKELSNSSKASDWKELLNNSSDPDKKDPSNNDSDFNDNVFSCEYDNGIYYIYADGTNQNDKPVSGFTDGAMGIVLVRKNGYISLGPFETTDANRFREEITQVCEDMAESKKMTREDADLILDIAEDIYEKEMQLNFGPSIVHEGAEILFYENGSLYLHDVITNHTDRTITETEYCMLAYDEDGHPLKIDWNFMDSSTGASYDYLVRTGGVNILPGQTEEYHGGWSLEEENAAHMAYNILYLKKVVFEDGTEWNNPEYEDWYETYAGKKISVEDLKNYYPHVYDF